MFCKNPVPPIQDFSSKDDLISCYPSDKATKDVLYHLLQSNTGPRVFKVSSVSFCVNGVATASDLAGFCHVKNVNSTFLFSSTDCGRFASKTKASQHKKICMHVYVLLWILQSSESSSLNLLKNHSTGNSILPSGSSDHGAVLDEHPTLLPHNKS